MTEEDALRIRKIESLIQDEVSMILETKISDEKIGMVTITRVKMTKDLKFANVYFTALGSEEERESSLKALTRASSRIQRFLGDNIRLKYTPVLRFFRDKGAESGFRVINILNDLRRKGRL
ncbi:MAG: ribosome-binding factor A [Candidatus Coatesbacteria bacterium 4484_99]|uniref:Ribosome-binding factor A n=1 Tax=Candidatus Coatesbacteria bacterium 4484_99 TaxID=1970774 RepID=A0A1W9S0G1_9BACT|nr:MAG: ribosome-binding factor A [Candidatus Coatesbacteria bacterium 4484_99]RLC41116.1 MAG: 30S ribosome-binding factor RbfA [Candidatus Coatesbacteria bacterium]RLC42634.1 MAG: 30S ribosome-binding factor RbfA [Candidatus Coatesbacteria bacterium]RLC44470.1 MAG: 30S ribosome-binding factor RbfA [Candidatus Coatesbacteria bacterium]